MADTKQEVMEVTDKLTKPERIACRTAWKRAAAVCDCELGREVVTTIARVLKNTPPNADANGKYKYSHGLVWSSQIKPYCENKGLSVWMKDRKSTHKSPDGKHNNDMDRLLEQMERVGLVARWRQSYRWHGLRAPVVTLDRQKALDTFTAMEAIGEAVAANREALPEAFTAAEPQKRKPRRNGDKKQRRDCADCGYPVDDCQCDPDDDLLGDADIDDDDDLDDEE